MLSLPLDTFVEPEGKKLSNGTESRSAFIFISSHSRRECQDEPVWQEALSNVSQTFRPEEVPVTLTGGGSERGQAKVPQV